MTFPSSACATPSCGRKALLRASYCLPCLDKIEAKRAVRAIREKSPHRLQLKNEPEQPTERLYVSTCATCSLTCYFRSTPEYAKLLHDAGVKCSRCRSALITIEQAIVGRLHQIEDLMSA